MKNYLTKISTSLLLITLVFSCDSVEDDKGSAISTLMIQQSGIEENGEWYSLENSPIMIPIYGDFANHDVKVTSSISSVKRIETERIDGSQSTDDKAIFIEYAPSGVEVESVDYKVYLDNELYLTDTIEIRPYQNKNDCSGSALADRFEVSEGGVLTVDLLDNEVFCNMDVSSRGIREFPISNFDGVLLSTTPDNTTLTYTPPAGFTGQVSFIYELCFGWSEVLEDGEEFNWLEPNSECPYHYVAMVTIDVVTTL